MTAEDLRGMAEKQIKKPQKRQKSKVRKEHFSPETEKSTEFQPLNHEQEKLHRWLQTVKFRKVLFGGIDEAQMWKKLEELDRLYEAAISAERARYDALLEKQMETGSVGEEPGDAY